MSIYSGIIIAIGVLSATVSLQCSSIRSQLNNIEEALNRIAKALEDRNK